MSTIYQEFKYGDIASLRGNGNLKVTSPRGIVILFPRSVHRVQRFRVEELGTWSYEWEDGMNGEFIVVPIVFELLELSESIDEVPEPERVRRRSLPTAGEKFSAFL